MSELMPAEEEPFEMQRPEDIIGPRYPLGHAVVIGIFSFECELEQIPGNRRGQSALVAAQTAISPDSPKSRVSVGN
jgi:hypothetical protein